MKLTLDMIAEELMKCNAEDKVELTLQLEAVSRLLSSYKHEVMEKLTKEELRELYSNGIYLPY